MDYDGDVGVIYIVYIYMYSVHFSTLHSHTCNHIDAYIIRYPLEVQRTLYTHRLKISHTLSIGLICFLLSQDVAARRGELAALGLYNDMMTWPHLGSGEKTFLVLAHRVETTPRSQPSNGRPSSQRWNGKERGDFSKSPWGLEILDESHKDHEDGYG